MDKPLIELIQTGGPYCDETWSYDVAFPEDWTVRNFIAYIVKYFSKESTNRWGSIFIYKPSPAMPNSDRTEVLEYDEGRCWVAHNESYLTEDRRNELKEASLHVLNEFIDSSISCIAANGGWSSMNYLLYIKKED